MLVFDVFSDPEPVKKAQDECDMKDLGTLTTVRARKFCISSKRDN